MNPLVKLLKKKQKREVGYGTVREVNTKDYRVRVELETGLKVYVKYNRILTSPEVGDTVLVGGENIKYVIQDAEGVVPKTHTILRV